MTDAEYERGKIQGATDTKLAEHSEHLAKINGSMGLVAQRLESISLTLQRLADAMDADRATVVTTATALEKAELARREKLASGWSRKDKFITVIVALAIVGTLLVTILVHVH
jgi:DNA-binding MarR family transcriptional regulator